MKDNMSEYPLVSVITVTYKQNDKLFNAISSVLSQNYENIEFIISDDGSDSFPEKEIREYIEHNKTKSLTNYEIIHHKNNIGTVRNLNFAFQRAKGKYIIEVAGDDVFFDKTVVKRIVERFILTGAEVLVTSRLVVDCNNRPKMLLPHKGERSIICGYKTGREQYYAFVKGMYYDMASGSAMYYLRDAVLKKGLFDEKYDLWEDGPFILHYTWLNKIECDYSIVSIRYCDTGVSSNDGSISETKKRLNRDEVEFFTKDIFQHFSEVPFKIRRHMQYRKLVHTGGKNRILAYCFFPDITAMHVIYKINRKIFELREKKYIKNL